MAPKKKGVSRAVLTIKTKQEIIAKVEGGQKAANVAKQYGLNRSTVCTILTKKDIIKTTQVAKGVTKITSAKQRGPIHEKMERILLVWINERQMKRDVTSMAIIQEKAREIFEELKQEIPSSASEELQFKATTGWFAKFKRRSGIKHVIKHGESTISADKEETEKYHRKDEWTTEELQEILHVDVQETKWNVSPFEQEEDEGELMSTSDIEDLLKKWEDVRAMVLKWHPNQTDVSRIGDLFDDHAINHFRKILKKRKAI